MSRESNKEFMTFIWACILETKIALYTKFENIGPGEDYLLIIQSVK